MDAKTYLAVAELVQAAAHQHGLVGPVEFTVCRPRDNDRSDTTETPVIRRRTQPLEDQEFFYARSGF